MASIRNNQIINITDPRFPNINLNSNGTTSFYNTIDVGNGLVKHTGSSSTNIQMNTDGSTIIKYPTYYTTNAGPNFQDRYEMTIPSWASKIVISVHNLSTLGRIYFEIGTPTIWLGSGFDTMAATFSSSGNVLYTSQSNMLISNNGGLSTNDSLFTQITGLKNVITTANRSQWNFFGSYHLNNAPNTSRNGHGSFFGAHNGGEIDRFRIRADSFNNLSFFSIRTSFEA